MADKRIQPEEVEGAKEDGAARVEDIYNRAKNANQSLAPMSAAKSGAAIPAFRCAPGGLQPTAEPCHAGLVPRFPRPPWELPRHS